MTSLHNDLLEQAHHLARRERNRPRQASLRRAVSAAYYALFHLLRYEAAASAAPSQPRGLRNQVMRVPGHADMKQVCRSLMGSHSPISTLKLMSLPMEPELMTVMGAFVELQEARIEADYDVAVTWSREEVLTKITAVQKAFEAWDTIRKAPNAGVFRAALLFQRQWGK